jgi:hypothetical protein
MTCFDCAPVTMNPPINTFAPLPTMARVEMFANFVGPDGGVGVVVGVAVGVGVGVGVGGAESVTT